MSRPANFSFATVAGVRTPAPSAGEQAQGAIDDTELPASFYNYAIGTLGDFANPSGADGFAYRTSSDFQQAIDPLSIAHVGTAPSYDNDGTVTGAPSAFVTGGASAALRTGITFTLNPTATVPADGVTIDFVGFTYRKDNAGDTLTIKLVKWLRDGSANRVVVCTATPGASVGVFTEDNTLLASELIDPMYTYAIEVAMSGSGANVTALSTLALLFHRKRFD